MTRIEGMVFCTNCGVEILWVPLIVGEHDYCCRDCYMGLPCECCESCEPEEERRARPAIPISSGY